MFDPIGLTAHSREIVLPNENVGKALNVNELPVDWALTT